MTIEQQREALAQIHDLRRRLAERDFSDVPDDPDAPDAEIIELEIRSEEKEGQKYDAEHPVMRRRRDTDG